MAKGDMFLKLDGAPGESNVPEHKDEIEILAWSWGMTSPTALGGAGATGRNSLSEIRFTKLADKATTPLMGMARNNAKVKATLSVRKSGSSPPIDYLVITVKNGRITTYNIGAESPGSPIVSESFAVAFEEIEVKYAAQETTGSKAADMVFQASVRN